MNGWEEVTSDPPRRAGYVISDERLSEKLTAEMLKN
jgi:hypothetical protein